MDLIARIVGIARIETIMNEYAKKSFLFIFRPKKLPSPTVTSQKDRVIPISSSLPEKVERRSRNILIWIRMEEKPIITKGIRDFILWNDNVFNFY